MTSHSPIWDKRFMRLALEARSWVKGPDLGVGACVVRPDLRGFSLGYSGLPSGMVDTNARITEPSFKDVHIVHAEVNAILNARTSVVGWTLYATTHPCSHCAATAIQAGIKRVVCAELDPNSRWYSNQLEAADALRETGVELTRLNMEEVICGF